MIGLNDKGNYAIALPSSHLSFGITKDGHWDKTVSSVSFWTSPVGSGTAYTLTPPATKFITNPKETIIPDGRIDYELVLTGCANDECSAVLNDFSSGSFSERRTQEIRLKKGQNTIDSIRLGVEIIKVEPASATISVKQI